MQIRLVLVSMASVFFLACGGEAPQASAPTAGVPEAGAPTGPSVPAAPAPTAK